jgi:hypothetical protein
VPVAHRVPALSPGSLPAGAAKRGQRTVILGRVEAHAVSERPSSLARIRAWPLSRWITPALLLACVLVGAWLLVDPRSPDLAAQSYRETLFARYGFTLWDENWYAGHHLPGYSLIFPWLALALGMRVVGALAVLVSTVAFERLVVPIYGPRARWGAVCFAIAAAGDLWIGRLTFALGVSFAMLAALAAARRRPWLAAALTAVCAATSPVAGLLLALAAVSWAIAAGTASVKRERWVFRACRGTLSALCSPPALALVAPVLLVVLPLEGLFPEGGWEPFALSSILANLGVVLAFIYALPRGQRTLRIGAFVYLFAVLISIVPAPMGSNIDRYAVLLAAPLLVCALARDGLRGNGRPAALTIAAVTGILIWTGWGPVRESAGVSGDPSTGAAYYRPLQRFLASHGGALVRVEIPFTHAHWEAALLAADQPLARGWERQLDTKYDRLFFGGTLTPARYARWLHEDAVSYVALPDVRLDGSSDQEAALIRHGQTFLREVLRTAHWRVFAVTGLAPLASAPARLIALGHDSFALRFARAGRSLVRVRYTRYWTPSVGGCVSEGAGGWTAVSARSAGVVRVSTRFSLARALGLSSGCSS